MPASFLHGVEVVEIDDGTRPIRTVKSSVIGIVGTAPDADPQKFPLNTPVLIAGSRTEAAPLGATGTLLPSINGIFDQCGALVVVVRVAADDDVNTEIANVVGGVDADTGHYTGVQALLSAESVLGVTPRLLIAPGYTSQVVVVPALIAVAERLRAIAIVDGPSTNDAEVLAYRKQFGSPRVYLVDPAVRVFDTELAAETVQPVSARAAGVIAKTDNDYGFWASPSNKIINGLVGTERPIDYTPGDANARANLLNEHEITTVIQQNGYLLWGNRTLSPDPKWAFLCVRRTADIINDSLLRAHMWAVDRGITKTYLHDVAAGVNAYLRDLKQLGAILGGECWADPEKNPPENIAAGRARFDFDFTPPTPGERLTFASRVTNKYLEDVL